MSKAEAKDVIFIKPFVRFGFQVMLIWGTGGKARLKFRAEGPFPSNAWNMEPLRAAVGTKGGNGIKEEPYPSSLQPQIPLRGAQSSVFVRCLKKSQRYFEES